MRGLEASGPRADQFTVWQWLGFRRKLPCANSLLRLAGCKEIAVALRDFCYRPRKLLQFLGIMKELIGPAQLRSRGKFTTKTGQSLPTSESHIS